VFWRRRSPYLRDAAGGVGDIGFWLRLARPTVGRLYRAAFRLRFRGLANIPTAGPIVLAINHVSVLDPLAVALATVSRGRGPRFLAAGEFFRHPLWGPCLRAIKAVPIRRGTGDVGALDRLIEVLRCGGLAGVFPEGEVVDTNRPDGYSRGRSGVARVAIAAGVPVIPVGVWGTQARWPRSGLKLGRPWRLPAAVAFGEPISPPADRLPGSVRRMTDEVMVQIQGQVDDARAFVEGTSGRSPRRHAPRRGTSRRRG
jgi:1-acyl-sn-glycerol-3-phosphate acyltransferase